MSVIKVIKIGLPVATATSAAIATTSLVSFSKKDKIQNEEDLDQELSDLNIPDEKYEDKELFYSKDGSGKNQAILDKALAEKLSQLLKEKGDFSDAKGPAPDLSKLNLDQVVQDAPPSHGQGQEHNDNKDQKETDPLGTKNDKPERTTDQSNSSDADDSELSEDEGPSLQIPMIPKAPDIEIKENSDSGSETTSLIKGDKGENNEGVSDQEKPDETSKELNLNDQKNDFENESTKQVENEPDQEDSNSQELGDSSTKSPSENESKDASSQALQQSQDDKSVQNSEDGGVKSVGGSHSKESPEDKGTSEKGPDDHSSGLHSNGIDSTGNKETFTEDDIKKWSELGDQLSSVAGQLMSLIDS
ncbi:hypothetical protein A6V39_05105 [Candidatus Mycoplasma haematobovis]|uniref:Uncharacterized protein n=1 Tax=Candidatus Mycoplasma haematobovis TaxID=432608 RepID=A0A1A9QCW5_9MOLU|nr:hypothetical protein [Candidatus Mycoplasma haematobovis]OAL09806.1 hypothetical protein A6V39_05105 [Candidatus Mycoplasma haematobovis]